MPFLHRFDTPAAWRAAQRWGRVLLWAIAAALAVRLGAFTVAALDRPAHGFVSHYTAGRLLLEGQDVARFYDDAWFAQQVLRFEPTITDLHGANLPTMSLVMAPLAALDYHTARALFALASLLVLLGVLWWLVRACRLGPLATPAFLAVALAFQPVRENLLHAQLYIAALALATLAFSGWRRGAPARTGAPLGLLLAAKSAGTMYWPMLAAARRFAPLGWAAAIAVALFLLSLALSGIEAWAAYIAAAGELTREPSLSLTAYQTQHSLLHHLFARDPRWNPQPLVHAPAAATALSLGLGLGMLGASLAAAWRRPRADLVFAAFTALALILSPVSLDYHYTLALLPVAIVLGDLAARPSPLPLLLLGAATFAIGADLPYRSPRLAAGELALFAYPKLYGAYLLWGLALWRAGRPGTPPLLRALRPHHWVKNLLVFVPVLVGHQADDPARLAQAALAFLAFSLAASAGYLLNDLADVEHDRAHRSRSARPFAAGELAPRTGRIAATLLFVAALATASLADATGLVLALAAYVALGLAYTLRLRALRFGDVAVLTCLYLVRVIGGGYASDTPPSAWLLAFSAAFFLGLALLKRYVELRGFADAPATTAAPLAGSRHVETPLAGTGLAGRGYAPDDAQLLRALGRGSGVATVAVLAAYAMSGAARVLYAHPWGVWLAALLVLFWIARAWKLAVAGKVDDDPVVFATRDPVTYLVALAAAAALALGAS